MARYTWQEEKHPRKDLLRSCAHCRKGAPLFFKSRDRAKASCQGARGNRSVARCGTLQVGPSQNHLVVDGPHKSPILRLIVEICNSRRRTGAMRLSRAALINLQFTEPNLVVDFDLSSSCLGSVCFNLGFGFEFFVLALFCVFAFSLGFGLNWSISNSYILMILIQASG